MVSEIGTCLIIASAAGGMQTRDGLRTINERKRTEPHRPWYTKLCKETQKTYRKCQNKYKINREIGNLKNLQVASKIYKKKL